MSIASIARRGAFLAPLVTALALSAPADAHWSMSAWTHKACASEGRNELIADPINFVWYGPPATAQNARYVAYRSTGWDDGTGDQQLAYTGGWCKLQDGQLAQAFGPFNSRFHIRFFQNHDRDLKGRWETASDAHHDAWDWGCLGHRVNTGGFDQGRDLFARKYYDYYGVWAYGAWVKRGNSGSVRQCNGSYVRGDGWQFWASL